jgi:hypothetical protein
VIDRYINLDRSGSVILEILLCLPKAKSQVLGQLGLQESIAVGCWYIWWKQEEIGKECQVATPTRTANALNANFDAAGKKVVHLNTAWNKPLKGYLKLNTDASYFSGGSGGGRAVIRNSMGEAIADCYEPFKKILPPFQNIRCFGFVKQMYLDTFSVYIQVNLHTKRCLNTFASQS